MVKQTITLMLFLCTLAYAQQVEISANHFLANELSGENILSGNVLIKRDKDILRSQKLTIYTDQNRRPLKYVASDDISFELSLKGKIYKGKANEFIYHVQKDIYEIKGNAFIEEITTKKKLYGQSIFVDRKKQSYSVGGSENKPARFIFQLKEK